LTPDTHRLSKTRANGEPQRVGSEHARDAGAGTTEREAALALAVEIPGDRRRVTLGADNNYDAREFVDVLRQGAITLHVAQNDVGTVKCH
jgi:hypothetical protein